MTYLKEIKSKNGRALSERLSHSGSGILAAALFGCFGLLASCTAGDDSLDNGTDTGANVKTASNVSVKQSSSDRITLFKTSGTRAVTRSADLTMSNEPTEAEIQAEVEAGTAYYVPYGNTMDDYNIYGNKYGVNLSQITTLYVGGNVKVTNNNSLPNKVVILSTGTLDASVTSPIGKEFYCYNTAEDAYTFQNGGYTLSSTSIFMTKGDYAVQGTIQGQLYVGGNLSSSSTFNGAGTIVVDGDVNLAGDSNSFGWGTMKVGGKLTSGKFYINEDGIVEIGCGLICTSTNASVSQYYLNNAALRINATGTLNLYENGFIDTPSTALNDNNTTVGGTINVMGNNCFLDLGDLAFANANTCKIDVTGANCKATVVANTLIANETVEFRDTDSDNSADAATIDFMRCSGTGASMDFYFNSPVQGNDKWANVSVFNFITNVTPYVNSTSVPETPTSCSSNTGNTGDDEPSNPPTDLDVPTTPTIIIDDIADIDHLHKLSATCVDWNEKNNKVYVCWHARGVGEAGCLEVFDHSSAEAPSLVSYMQAWSGNMDDDYAQQNDTMKYIDYNHCIYDEAQNRLYAVGNCNAVGGHLSYINLGNDGTFDDSKEYDTYEDTEDITNNGVLTYQALTKGDKNSCDGNCIIRQGDDFLVASTSGFETFDANLKSTNFVASEGKGKHIATDGTNILTLNYNRFIDKDSGENEDTPLQAVVKNYAASDHTFSTPNTVIDATETIAPNDGKNTIAVNGNYAYVCLSENGLVIYDLNGNKINSFVKDKVKIQGVEVAGGLCNGVAVDDDYIYVAYGSFGLYVFDKAKALDGETMEPVASYKCSKSCNYIKVVDRDGYHYLYIAYGESGLKVCRIAQKNA